MFTPKDGVVDSYVVEEVINEKENKITDFISFYTVKCSVLKHETIKEYKVFCYCLMLQAAYVFYYVSNNINELMKNALIFAKRSEHDVFYCLNLMDNQKFLEVG